MNGTRELEKELAEELKSEIPVPKPKKPGPLSLIKRSAKKMQVGIARQKFRSVQDSIYYEKIFESGVCYIGNGSWSKTIEIEDISYSQATYEAKVSIYSKYSEFLNTLNTGAKIQISIINTKRVKDPLAARYLKNTRDGLDEYRKEINDLLHDKLMNGNNSIARRKYLTFSVNATDTKSAAGALNRQEAAIVAQLKGMGCNSRPLEGIERVSLLYNQLNPGEPFELDFQELVDSFLTTKDIVSPDSMSFKDSIYSYTLGSNKFACVLCLSRLPAQMGDKLLTELSDMPINMSISMHISALDHHEALEIVKKKIAFMDAQTIEEQRKAMKAGYDSSMIPHELEYSRAEAKNLLESMEQYNQRLFFSCILVSLVEDNKDELDSSIKAVQDIARKNGCELRKVNYEQEAAMNSCLPLGELYLDRQRTLPTSSAAIFMPFSAKEAFDVEGNYVGVNAHTRNLVMLDKKKLKSKNTIVLGIPGSGKSFSVKKDIIMNFFHDEDSEIVILDPEREYSVLVNMLGGEVVQIGGSSKTHINPLDITEHYDDEAEPIELKINFIFSFFEAICGKVGLTPTQRTIIDRVSRRVYSGYLFAGEAMPTLNDFYDRLLMQSEADAKALALSLEMYLKGTMSNFAHQTDVDTSNRIVCFDIKDMGASLKTVGMLIVLDQIWNRIAKNRALGKKTWVYVDEAQLLFSHPESAEYFSALNSRGRKWGTGVTTITQNAQNLLLNENARTIFSNAGSILLFSQAHTDLSDLANVLSLDKSQLEFVSDSKPGQGLLIVGNSLIPFYDDFPKETVLYSAMTSKPEEVRQFSNQWNI
ncbi:MAG: ATP-binding protein [Eubacteriaceae bacterium]|nr:ATP-binding protein [Eubacteriaceae bacterium]